jgi:putative transposase
MARQGRAVAVGYPHLVRVGALPGRKLFLIFKHGLAYLLYLRRECRRRRVRVLAWWQGARSLYLLMIPRTKSGMALALREAHRKYAKARNVEAGARGAVFAPHYDSCVVSWARLADAARFVETGALPAGPGPKPWNYLWSSARYNCRMRPLDPLVARRVVRELVADWRRFLVQPVPAEEAKEIKSALKSGRVLGDRKFAARMGRSTQKRLRKQKPGPKPDPDPAARRRPNYWHRLLCERPW